MKWTLVLFDYRKVGELTKKYSNLPDSYIKRAMEQIIYRTPKGPQYLPRSDGKKRIKFTKNRPWTFESKMENPLHKGTQKIFVEPIKEWTIFSGDRVEILDGKDKNKQGIVNSVFQERNWVTVTGLNRKLKTLHKNKNLPSVVIQEELPLRVTDQVALIDPSDLLPCKVEWRYTEKGEKVRISLRTGRIIPMPRLSEETYDYKTAAVYEEKKKDTPAHIVSKVTFKPYHGTFEMDIMEHMGIKEDRVPAPAYWY